MIKYERRLSGNAALQFVAVLVSLAIIGAVLLATILLLAPKSLNPVRLKLSLPWKRYQRLRPDERRLVSMTNLPPRARPSSRSDDLPVLAREGPRLTDVDSTWGDELRYVARGLVAAADESYGGGRTAEASVPARAESWPRGVSRSELVVKLGPELHREGS